MSQKLSQMVAAQAAKAVSIPLGAWVRDNPLPCYVEQKIDGIRVWLVKNNDDVVIATKHDGVYAKDRYPQLLDFNRDRANAPKKLILDCEFTRNPPILHVFDIINYAGEDCRNLVLQKRRRILDAIELPEYMIKSHVWTLNTLEDVMKLKDSLVASGAEGIMVKNPNSTYGQTGSWLKLKKYDTIDVFVTGRDTEHEHPTYYISCYDSSGQVVDMGKVGSFVKDIDHNKITNDTVLEIQYQEITKDNRLRHPFCIRIRTDKTKEECIS